MSLNRIKESLKQSLTVEVLQQRCDRMTKLNLVNGATFEVGIKNTIRCVGPDVGQVGYDSIVFQLKQAGVNVKATTEFVHNGKENEKKAVWKLSTEQFITLCDRMEPKVTSRAEGEQNSKIATISSLPKFDGSKLPALTSEDLDSVCAHLNSKYNPSPNFLWKVGQKGQIYYEGPKVNDSAFHVIKQIEQMLSKITSAKTGDLQPEVKTIASGTNLKLDSNQVKSICENFKLSAAIVNTSAPVHDDTAITFRR